MKERIKDLFPSLVGSSTEFNFRNKLASVTDLTDNIRCAKERISKDISKALSVGGNLCVMLLAELTNFYRNEIYYMAVRSSIEMRRFRPRVLEYMQLSVPERAKRLKEELSANRFSDKGRELKITTLRYFLSTYPSRAREFKDLLSREEYLLVV